MKNANVIITMDDDRRELRNNDIYISEGKIKEIGKNIPSTRDFMKILSDN